MAAPMDTGLPLGLDLADGWTVRFTALTATTGVVDPSVIISGASLLVDNLGGGDLTAGFKDLPPILQYEQESDTLGAKAAGAIGGVLPGGGGL